VTAWIARDGRVLRCPLTWPDPDHTVKLAPPGPITPNVSSGASTTPVPALWLSAP
jgi:hypothetical protein